MPRACSVCQHEHRDRIDPVLLAGASYRAIARQFALSKDAVARHCADHLPETLAKAQQAADVAHADDLLAEVRTLQQTALTLLGKAEAAGDLRTALVGVREVRACLELLARLLGELDERPQLNILITPAFVTVQAAIITALAPYPEARAAVAAAMRGVEVAGG